MSNIVTAVQKLVREILVEKYAVDFYQREYKWGREHVSELLGDLVSVFSPQWAPAHPEEAILGYRGYFLGSITVSERNAVRYIVDGQQRLTTLTLLLIALRDRVDATRRGQLEGLVSSVHVGKHKFNLDIPERNECLSALCNGVPFDKAGKLESVRNIVSRHGEINEALDNLKTNDGRDFPFPFFADWLIERVCLAEIKASSDKDAYTVFETMNDRGLPLTPTEMLKGYLLSNIGDLEIRRQAEDTWKDSVGQLVNLGEKEDASAIEAWLRGRYAQKIRERKRNATPEDFDRIGTKFHRWVRDNEGLLRLEADGEFVRFIDEFSFYTDWYIRLRGAAAGLNAATRDGLESVYHNAESDFTLQYPVLLASLSPGDSDAVALPKLRVVAAYLDILIYRRIWGGKSIGYSTMSYAMFSLMRDIRDLDTRETAEFMKKRLDDASLLAEPFSTNPHFHLHGNNKPKVRQILARMTAMLDQWAGKVPSYVQCYTNYAKQEIEHIWADKYEDNDHGHNSEFESKVEFQGARNRVGGLLLLPKRVNSSFNDKPYEGQEGKLGQYLRENLLAQSLHPKCYKNNPAFLQFVRESGLPFKSHPEFKKSDLEERQALYLQLAEQIWSPARLREAAES